MARPVIAAFLLLRLNTLIKATDRRKSLFEVSEVWGSCPSWQGEHVSSGVGVMLGQ